MTRKDFILIAGAIRFRWDHAAETGTARATLRLLVGDLAIELAKANTFFKHDVWWLACTGEKAP
jgi:hypothetical protein